MQMFDETHELSNLEGEARELKRQQQFLLALRQPAKEADLHAKVLARGRAGYRLSKSQRPSLRGLEAYRVNAGAFAQRALEANYPTILLLMGEDTFAALARQLWSCCPPTRGDLAWFGETLPEFLANQEHLSDWPYLSEVARLDWAVSRAYWAFDVEPHTDSLNMLAHDDPAELQVVLASGLALIDSSWPVVTLWKAHHSQDEEAGPDLSLAQEALAQQRSECALVWRSGWRVQVAELPSSDRWFVRALLQPSSLASALDHAGDAFDLSACLQRGLQAGWWLGMTWYQEPAEGSREYFALMPCDQEG